MNDWKIRNCLIFVFSIQFAILGAIGLNIIGIQIPIIIQLVSFIYIIIIPGTLILRILKLHKLGNIETLLYTVGLSISFLMITGLLMNSLYPLFGIFQPISITPLIISTSTLVMVLCILSYMRDKSFYASSFIKMRDIFSPPVLFLCLLPLLSILGTYRVNFHQNNIILMSLIIIIALIVVLIGFDFFIHSNLYPLAVFSISISLLFHNSLISEYLWGYDIHLEYYYSNIVIANSLWDSTFPSNINSMLSITMLAPIFVSISGMSLTWVLKIIYPLLFSLVSLGIYRVFQKQTNDKIAFLSVFFFMSLFSFYTEMLSLARQQIAELFLALIILLIIDKNMNRMKRSMLYIVFSVSLIVSHYGLSYIVLFSTIAVWFLIVSKAHYKKKNIISTLTTNLVLLFFILTITWYIFISGSSNFNSIVQIGDHIASSISTELFNPESAEGLKILLTTSVSPLHNITKYLHICTQLFITVGIVSLLLKDNELKFTDEFKSFAIINFMINLASIAISYFASSINTTRLYQISLFFLAPIGIIGGITIYKMITGRISWINGKKNNKNALKALSVFLMIYFLFNVGFIYEVANNQPTSVSLSQEGKNLNDTMLFYTTFYPEQDILGVEWISKNRNQKSIIFADLWHKTLVFSSYGMMHNDGYILTNTTKILNSSYIYLGYPNVRYGLMYGTQSREYWNITESSLLEGMNKIYANSDAQVYYR